MKRAMQGLLCLLLAVFMNGCMSLPREDIIALTPALEPQQPLQVQPVSEPVQSPEEKSRALERLFRVTFANKMRAYFDASCYEPMLVMDEVVKKREKWLEIKEALSGLAEKAFIEACAKEDLAVASMEAVLPDWKLVATIFHRFGTYAVNIFAYNSGITVTIADGGASLRIALDNIREIIKGEDPEIAFGCKLTFSYLNTIYDDEGKEKDFIQYKLSDEYIKNLTDPLPGSHIKDGWYANRSRGTRKHTGTDIKSPENTPILSCTDGVIQNIGSNSGAGNYVTVLDDMDFEYHYYHMVRLTDFLLVGDRVKKGDVIGHVGNTGNSTANHLHLTIISPGFTYINPYPVLKTMRAMRASLS